MKSTIKICICILAMTPYLAMAAAACKAYPKEEWAEKSVLRQGLETEGYKIKLLHIHGNCYEIYGFNNEGKPVEIYFDMKTLAIVKAINLKE